MTTVTRESSESEGSGVFAGVDVGSLFTKVVLLSGEGKVLASNILASGAFYEGAAETCLNQALTLAGLKMEDISYIVGTGYGRSHVPFANATFTEIKCHAEGARKYFPDANTVIDIGGQDSKVIWLNDEGKVANFVMNDKCAAGTGRFFEVMAGALGVEVGEMARLASESQNEVQITSTCTVFAETEVISLFSQKTAVADIAAGLIESIAGRVVGLVSQYGLKEPGVVTGGVARNGALVKALEGRLRTTLRVSPEPQINGALGAAFLAAQQAGKELKALAN